MESSDRHIIKIKNLYAGYRTRRQDIVLTEGLDLDIHKGQLIAIMGRNGSGKSTLLRTICGLQQALSGNILVRGTSIRSMPLAEKARLVSFVSTETVHASHMRIYDLVALGRMPFTGWLGRLSSRDKEIIGDSMAATGLKEKQEAFVDELSDGERQRAMIARALSQDTEIIFMDEPTAFLDVMNRYAIFHLLQKLTRTQDKTIVFSTHDLNIALAEADRILLLDNKKLVHGAPEDLLLSEQLMVLFDREHMEFDSNNASLSLKKEFSNQIRIEGAESKAMDFTVKAMERLGYKISYEKDFLPVIHVKQPKDNYSWGLQKKSETLEFNSIYDLSLYLRDFQT